MTFKELCLSKTEQECYFVKEKPINDFFSRLRLQLYGSSIRDIRYSERYSVFCVTVDARDNRRRFWGDPHYLDLQREKGVSWNGCTNAPATVNRGDGERAMQERSCS